MKFDTIKTYTLSEFPGKTYKLKGLVFEPAGNENDAMFADILTDIDGYPVGFVDSKHYYHTNYAEKSEAMRETEEPKRYQVAYNTEENSEYVVSIGKYGSISEFIAGWCNSPISTLKNVQLLA
jgi:hypothetical protein